MPYRYRCRLNDHHRARTCAAGTPRRPSLPRLAPHHALPLHDPPHLLRRGARERRLGFHRGEHRVPRGRRRAPPVTIVAPVSAVASTSSPSQARPTPNPTVTIVTSATSVTSVATVASRSRRHRGQPPPRRHVSPRALRLNPRVRMAVLPLSSLRRATASARLYLQARRSRTRSPCSWSFCR